MGAITVRVSETINALSMFAIRDGGLVVQHASTVICIRHAGGKKQILETAGLPEKYVGGMLEGRRAVEFHSGWEVLLGQAEVKNWMRSSQESSAIMRYAGEFKFAGGVVDNE